MKAPATQFAATRSHSSNERDSAPGAGVRGIEDFQPASPEVERSPSRTSSRTEAVENNYRASEGSILTAPSASVRRRSFQER